MREERYREGKTKGRRRTRVSGKVREGRRNMGVRKRKKKMWKLQIDEGIRGVNGGRKEGGMMEREAKRRGKGQAN